MRLRYFVFEPRDVATLLATTMRLMTRYDLIKDEVDEVRAKAAKPFFGQDAF